MKNKKITLKASSGPVLMGWIKVGEEVTLVDEMNIAADNGFKTLFFVENKNKMRLGVYHEDIEVMEVE